MVTRHDAAADDAAASSDAANANATTGLCSATTSVQRPWWTVRATARHESATAIIWVCTRATTVTDERAAAVLSAKTLIR